MSVRFRTKQKLKRIEQELINKFYVFQRTDYTQHSRQYLIQDLKLRLLQKTLLINKYI